MSCIFSVGSCPSRDPLFLLLRSLVTTTTATATVAKATITTPTPVPTRMATKLVPCLSSLPLELSRLPEEVSLSREFL